MHDIQDNLRVVKERITLLEQCFGRPYNSVCLLAVSKTHPTDAIRSAVGAGQRRFGESYLQQALPKIAELANCALEWHFIGSIQSNKTKGIAACFDWVHSVERIQIAQRLSEQRSADLLPLNVCIQVNIRGERTKSGVTLEALPHLTDAVASLPRLRLRGLMTIPSPCLEFENQRVPYRQLREAFNKLISDGHPLDTLSMGMSNDMEAAIAEGATLVRIGTAIFGPRAHDTQSNADNE